MHRYDACLDPHRRGGCSGAQQPDVGEQFACSNRSGQCPSVHVGGIEHCAVGHRGRIPFGDGNIGRRQYRSRRQVAAGRDDADAIVACGVVDEQQDCDGHQNARGDASNFHRSHPRGTLSEAVEQRRVQSVLAGSHDRNGSGPNWPEETEKAGLWITDRPVDGSENYWLAAAFVVEDEEELLDEDESDDFFSAGFESLLVSDFVAAASDFFSLAPSLAVPELPRLSVR